MVVSLGVLEPLQGSYHVKANEHYYSEGGQASSYWYGKGARALGLRGEVLATPYLRLFAGRHPETGALLGQHQRPGGNKKTSHRPGHDLAFNEIKELTVFRSCLPEPERRLIDRARDEALQVVLDYIESDLLKVRRGQGGKRLESAKAVMAAWKHSSNRGGENHEHTHVVILNVAECLDGSIAKVSADEVVAQSAKLGAMYRLELCARLSEYGLDLRPVTRGRARVYTIEGVPRAACKELSQARQRIEDKLAEMGVNDPKSAERANRLVRANKQNFSPEAVRAHTRAVAAAHGFTQESALALLTGEPKRLPEHEKARLLERALDRALGDLATEQGCFTKPQLERRVCEELQATGIKSHEALHYTDRAIEGDARLTQLKGRYARRDQPLYSTVQAQSALEAVRDQVTLAKDDTSHKIQGEVHAAPELAKAANELVGPGRVKCLSSESPVAAAKTQEALAAAYKSSGFEVVGVAPRKASARAQERASRITSYSAEEAFERFEPRPEGVRSTSSRFARVKEQLGMRPRRVGETIPLTPKTVVIVDQAHRFSSAQLNELVTLAEEGRAKLILSGDRRGSFGSAPSAYGNIAEAAGEVRPVITREDRPLWRVLSERDLSEGSTRSALERFTREGALSLRGSSRMAMAEAVDGWLDAHKKRGVLRSQPTNDVIVTSSAESKRNVNAAVQRARRELGEIAHPCAQTASGALYVGDRVRITTDAPQAQVLRGDSGVLVDIESRVTDGGMATFAVVRMDNDAPKGWMRSMRPHHVEVNLDETAHWLELGYAVQPKDVPDVRPDKAIVLFERGMDDADLLAVSAYSDDMRVVGVRGDVPEDVQWHHEASKESERDFSLDKSGDRERANLQPERASEVRWKQWRQQALGENSQEQDRHQERDR